MLAPRLPLVNAFCKLVAKADTEEPPSTRCVQRSGPKTVAALFFRWKLLGILSRKALAPSPPRQTVRHRASVGLKVARNLGRQCEPELRQQLHVGVEVPATVRRPTSSGFHVSAAGVVNLAPGQPV